MIHNQRLEKYIKNKEWRSSKDFLLGMYDAMTLEQRQEIKEMFVINKNLPFNINLKYANKK